MCDNESAGHCRFWCTATTIRSLTAGDFSGACCSSGALARARVPQKGFEDLPERIGLTKQLIDRFNVQVKGVAAIAEFPHVRYVNIRGTLSTGADYKRWWANELHPTNRGFAQVTERFAAALAALP